MKCHHCGGSVIYHLGNCLEKAALKCMACGRPHEEEGKMESETKKCSKCLEEKLLEEFYIHRSNPDGREYHCKDCKNKRMQEVRDLKAGRKTSLRARGRSGPAARKAKVRRTRRTGTLPNFSREICPGSQRKKMGGVPITRATPEQIIGDLRRGLAIEIIEMIQEKFGL